MNQDPNDAPPPVRKTGVGRVAAFRANLTQALLSAPLEVFEPMARTFKVGPHSPTPELRAFWGERRG